MRLRGERYRNNEFGGANKPDDAYGWIRVLPYADLHLGPNLRFFGQLVGAWAGSQPTKGPVDETGMDLLQGFALARLPAGPGALTLQGGRQLLAYGPST